MATTGNAMQQLPITVMGIRQTLTKECGGWTVLTYVRGQLRRQHWTAGNITDAKKTAAEDRAELAAEVSR